MHCERKFTNVALDDVEPDGSFSGYASLFGRVDLGRDVVERGAFSRSLAERGAAGVRMLFQHDPNQPIGAMARTMSSSAAIFRPAAPPKTRPQTTPTAKRIAASRAPLGKR